ncbi:hypothetical protein BJ166DRAFT_493124 [Pestalotiopsis sp. NC0098]|nr:hypothetical protein BJ166DRAFT_493124 [Pestalotiopsis sp. NC0098]
MSAFGNILDEVVRLFGSVGPLWLVLFLGTSIYAVFYRFVFLTLLALPEDFMFGRPSSPVPGNRNAGYAILFVLGLLKATWVAAWCMGMFITFFCDRHWESPTEAKVIMQGGRGFEPGTIARWNDARRPRVCLRCDAKSADRVYHCTETKRCLPIYDHFCPWVQICVYARTMKAYLYMMLFLGLDIFATLAVLVYAFTLTSSKSHNVMPFVASAACALLALIVGVALWGPKQWKHLAIKNEVLFEWRGEPRKPQLLAFKDSRDGMDVMRLVEFQGNPWDRGTLANMRQVLGERYWMWLLFWWQPKRVANYGQYDHVDLPYSLKAWEMRRQLLIDEPLDEAAYRSVYATIRVPRRLQSRSTEVSSMIPEEPQLRRRENRTS